ncbi:Oidioi.mRNA.OKI2018_I69.chr2.g7099.t1.cds [Oikopleura dioica]|uniref:Oidioi.mRNA.OKI2018_I69.chr2.g7099.t1.cds n=1 Tax=Oikopleura dioica TaxID=34765 RepID=A0ABN7T5J2_OIKDI|nr:Oidioi.mRNA.OKI2018_I69.chr2.g7099.t1.cds [Oikopleura dioica]
MNLKLCCDCRLLTETEIEFTYNRIFELQASANLEMGSRGVLLEEIRKLQTQQDSVNKLLQLVELMLTQLRTCVREERS